MIKHKTFTHIYFFWHEGNIQSSLKLLSTHHGLSQSLLDQVDAALVHRLTVRQEAALQGRGYRRQTLRRTDGEIQTEVRYRQIGLDKNED